MHNPCWLFDTAQVLGQCKYGRAMCGLCDCVARIRLYLGLSVLLLPWACASAFCLLAAVAAFWSLALRRSLSLSGIPGAPSVLCRRLTSFFTRRRARSVLSSAVAAAELESIQAVKSSIEARFSYVRNIYIYILCLHIYIYIYQQ